MAIKLHRCSGTLIKGPHPCWKAQKALDDAGIDYELVTHSPVRFRRPEVEAMTGQRKLPFVEFEDGTILSESAEIAARASAGTLLAPPAAG
ncbi:MAG TPA: glutathione S-transferase N-terminal domain-containing protein [Gaiellales bacterium]|jgi:glutathione S-transferase